VKKILLPIFVAILLSSTVFYSKLTLPKGDEVHYLISAESIVNDGDLYLENNYSIDTIRKFGYEALDRHIVVGRGGHEVLGHGLTIFPILIAPFYFVAGRLGVSLFLGIIAFFLFKETVRFCQSVSTDTIVVWGVCLSFFLTLPLAQYSLLIFPEIMAGLLIIYILRKTFLSNKLTLGSALLIGLLPWIHLRFLTVSIFFILFWLSKSLRKSAKTLVLPLILVLLYFLTNFAVFGGFDINKSFMNAASVYSGDIISNVINLLVDRQYGLISNNPMFILVIPGMYFWFRRSRGKAITILLLIGSVLAPFINSNDWHGGFAPPGRYLVAIIPVVIPAAVLTIAYAKSLLAKAIWLSGFIWGYLVYLINLLNMPNNGFLYKDGITPYLSELSVRTGFYLYRLIPGYFPDEKITTLHWLWIGLILLVSYLISRGARVGKRVFR